MKNCFFGLLLILIASLLIKVNAQDFRKVTDYSYPTISDAFFLTNTSGWFVSSGGDVRKTTNGGVTWTKLQTNIIDNLLKVYFLNENVGFAGGTGAAIFKTTDGGTNWTPILISGGTGTLYGLYFTDENHGWILSSTSSAAQVSRTTDGGATWNVDLNYTLGDLENMHFFDATHGIVVGGGVGKIDLFYTTNGTTWTKSPNPTVPTGYTRTDVRGVYMLSSTLAYAVGWGSSVGLQPSILLKSTNGGATWEYLTQLADNRTYDNLWAVYFKDANNGVAFGGATRGTVFIRTTDGGQNWLPENIPCGVQLNTINGFGDELIVSGSSGVIMRTTDFGNTWQMLTPIPNGNVNSIAALSDNLVIGGGFNSVFLKTTDRGVNWQGGFVSADGSAPNIQGIYFVNENVGYSAHSYGMAAKTTDGGQTWKQVIPVTLSATTSLYAPFFLDENYGFIVGKESNNVDIIYKTTNGGLTWDTKTNSFATNLRGVAFKDVNNGIVVGEKLKAAFTTDGGVTWTPSVFDTLPPVASPNLLGVTFTNGLNAIAVGDQLILRSSNGGANWNYSPVSNLVETLNSAAFANANEGWVVGSKTTAPRSVGLYFTSDAGFTWSNRADISVFDTVKTLYDVSITPSGHIWIGSASSTIYTNSPIVGINDRLDNSASFTLEQNYPNPFNPSTIIRYSIDKSQHVDLKVFDLLGREIAVLVNEEKSAGTYEVKFQAAMGKTYLADGIYFYRLNAGGYSFTKKMILLK